MDHLAEGILRRLRRRKKSNRWEPSLVKNTIPYRVLSKVARGSKKAYLTLKKLRRRKTESFLVIPNFTEEARWKQRLGLRGKSARGVRDDWWRQRIRGNPAYYLTRAGEERGTARKNPKDSVKRSWYKQMSYDWTQQARRSRLGRRS